MDGAKRQAVILALIAKLRSQDSWCGETHVQKSSHFLQEGLGVPLEVEFVMYKHGPFSFDLRELLGELVGSQLLEVEPRPPYGPRLRPSESGDALMARFPKTCSRYSRSIDFVAEKLASRDVLGLEKLGTALFVTKELATAPPGVRADEIRKLKPHVDKATALEAIKEIDALLAEARARGIVDTAAN
jgi:hypothetical protein